jgi:hypothetical protein
MSCGGHSESIQHPTDPLHLRDRLVSEAQLLIERGQTDNAMQVLKKLEFATIDEHTIQMTDAFFQAAIAGQKRVVASFDPHRVPADGEFVVIYGNYAHVFENIIVNNPVKRHVSLFCNLPHDVVEYNSSWESVNQIFILNIGSRTDRYDSVLRELACARAPFHRITRVEAVPPDHRLPDRKLAATISCLEGHREVLRRAAKCGYENILVLEDDFCFTSDVGQHLDDLRRFFERCYDYIICLLATSKYGRIVEKDDLVSLSFQPCTNAGGYLLSRSGMDALRPVQDHALEMLRLTGEPDFAADRCWAALQPTGKFLTFRRKFGFQSASFSNIEDTIARYFD